MILGYKVWMIIIFEWLEWFPKNTLNMHMYDVNGYFKNVILIWFKVGSKICSRVMDKERDIWNSCFSVQILWAALRSIELVAASLGETDRQTRQTPDEMKWMNRKRLKKNLWVKPAARYLSSGKSGKITDCQEQERETNVSLLFSYFLLFLYSVSVLNLISTGLLSASPPFDHFYAQSLIFISELFMKICANLHILLAVI